MKLLIVDDNEIFVESLAVLMDLNGFEYRFATNGDDAIKKCMEFVPDIVILDILMPGFDGLKVCRIIKRNVRLNHAYVMILSALDSRNDKLRARKAGADEYLVKPYSPSEIIEKIKQLEKSLLSKAS